MKITIVAASEGKNLELAQKFKEYFDSKNIDSEVIDLVKFDLPLFTPTTEKIHNALTVISPLSEALKAQAFVFVAPEYNGGPPPTLVNFLAWVSRSTKNWRETFNGKPTAIATHSDGGGINLLNIMRLQLAYIGLNVIGRQIHTTLQKPLDQNSLIAVCEQLIKQAKA